MDSFVLLAYASFAASGTLLQELLACMTFSLESEDLSFGTKEKSNLYELWQPQKQLKTLDMNEVWVDIFYEGYIYIYIYISILAWTHSQNSLAAAKAPSLKVSSHGASLKWSRRPSQSAEE